MSCARVSAVLVAVVMLALAALGLGWLGPPARAEGEAVPAAGPSAGLVGTAFTYQGQLTQGGLPAAGTFDFEFRLFEAATGGAALASVAQAGVLVTGGLFTAFVDFGPGQITGQERYLEISVRPSGGGSYVALSPRQPLSAAPFALALPGLYTRPGATSPDIIGGHPANRVADLVVGAVIAGGGNAAEGHYVGANYATIGGGLDNTVTGLHAAIGGGAHNRATHDSSTVAGGWNNGVASYAAFVGGGSNNRANGDRTVVAGGYSNVAEGDLAAIGGGSFVQAFAPHAAIGGGLYISVTGYAATVGGGQAITVTGVSATVGGGVGNHVAPPAHGNWGATAATIGGGEANRAAEAHATVGGGGRNQATGYASVVAGGGGYEAYRSLLPEWPSAGNIAAGSWSTVGGGGGNRAIGFGATIAGGKANEAVAEFATVGGGGPERSDTADPAGGNRVTDAYGTVGGGSGNHAGGTETFPTDSTFATVSGGRLNMATWRAATVGGGEGNVAAGMYATIPGGQANQVNAEFGFAAGRHAQAQHQGAFVWADSLDAIFPSIRENEVAARATGGVRLALAVDGTGQPTWVCSVVAGGAWACSSDRNLKESLGLADGRDVLARLARVPIYTWSARGADPAVRHIGPMAQDFHAAFGLGQDDVSISTIDLDGVALAAIGGLHDVASAQAAEIERLERRLDQLDARLSALEAGDAGQNGGREHRPEGRTQ